MKLTTDEIRKFANHCKSDNLDLNTTAEQKIYESLTLCLFDSIFSVYAKYKVAENVIQKYSEKLLEEVKNAANQKISDFIDLYEKVCENGGNAQTFTNTYLGCNNKIRGQLKIISCYKLAKEFQKINIETIEDFQNYKKEHEKDLEKLILSVFGFGHSSTDNLFILCGDTSRVRVNTHINNYVTNALNRELTYSETKKIFREAVKILNEKYPNLTVADLDHAIWLKNSNSNNE